MASSQQVAHLWANASAKGAKKGSSFFRELWDDGRVSIAYSFGHHYVAGIIDTVNGRAFINEYVYSNYTSRHLSLCQRAINESLTPDVYHVSNDGMDALESLLKGAMRTEYDARWKGIVYATYRDNALEAIKSYKGVMTKEGEPRLSTGVAWRYTNALEMATKAREFMGQRPIGCDEAKKATYEAYLEIRKEKNRIRHEQEAVLQRKRELDAMKNPKRYAEWKQERLSWIDPSKSEWQRFGRSRNTPITLTVDGNHVKASNDNQVTISTARRILGLWDKAVKSRITFTQKEMTVGNYTGVCLRYNGTVKIGCTRILPDEVMKLQSILQTTGVGNETESETEI